METNSILAQEHVMFRGIWMARNSVSEKLILAISRDFPSKPARPARLELTPACLNLNVLPTTNGKPGRRDQIIFEALRDVTLNRFNSHCLLVVYVDSKNMFSLLVCSSENERDLGRVVRAYKQHRELLIRNKRSKPPMVNWTLQQQKQQQLHQSSHPGEREFLHDNKNGNNNNGSDNNNNSNHSNNANTDKRMLVNGHAERERNFSYSEDSVDGEVFILEDGPVTVHHEKEDLERYPVEPSTEGEPGAFSVGVQAGISDADSDNESMMSTNSLQSMRDDIQSLSEEMKAIKFLLEKSTGVSAEEYYRRRDMAGNRHAVAFHTKPILTEPTNGNGGQKRVTIGAVEQGNGYHDYVQAGHPANNDKKGDIDDDDDEDYDLRSVGMQTEREPKRIRYTKRPGTIGSTNPYKEMASLRKRNDESLTSSEVSRSSVQSISSTGYAGARDSASSKLYVRGMPSPSSGRPVENVYYNQQHFHHPFFHGGSRGFQNRRFVLRSRPQSGPRPSSSSSKMHREF